MDTKLIESVVCIPENSIFSRSRKKDIITARNIYFFCRIIEKSFNQIEVKGYNDVMKETGWNYSTIIHSIKTVLNWIKVDKYFRSIIESIISIFELNEQYQYFIQIPKKYE